MPAIHRIAPVVLLAFTLSCGSDTPTACCDGTENALRLVNAFTGPIDVLVDGTVVIEGMTPTDIRSVKPRPGKHTVAIRATGSATTSTQDITTEIGAINTIAALKAAVGVVGSAVLDDTSNFVPLLRTRVRVVHLAPNAGPLQVYRIQPDNFTPTAWSIPFVYQPEPSSVTAPFYESVVGTWEIHVWQTPANATGWFTAPVKVVIPLLGLEKRTVLLLDQIGGGVKYVVI